MTKRKSKAAAPNRVAIVLDVRHTHAGRECAPGDIIHVSAPEARWLIEHGIGDAVADSHTTESKR